MNPDLWRMAAARMARTTGLPCAVCGRPHPASSGQLVDDSNAGTWCTCPDCCGALLGEAVAVLKRLIRQDCERTCHPGLRCSERVHGCRYEVLSVAELDLAIAAAEADLSS